MHWRTLLLALIGIGAWKKPGAKTEKKTVIPFQQEPWFPHLKSEAAKNRIPLTVALSLVQQESSGRTNAVGSAGEFGLLQLKEGVAQDYARVNHTTLNLYDTRNNITLGLWYLAYLRDHWELTLHDALLAYNSGIGNFLKGKIQNQNYASAILERAKGWT